jgi:hypothetical protein
VINQEVLSESGAIDLAQFPGGWYIVTWVAPGREPLHTKLRVLR